MINVSFKNGECSRSLEISDESYRYMISDEGKLGEMPWAKMNGNKRLKAHLDALKDTFGMTSYSYEILEE